MLHSLHAALTCWCQLVENERLRDRIAELTALSGGGPSEVTAAAVGEVAAC